MAGNGLDTNITRMIVKIIIIVLVKIHIFTTSILLKVGPYVHSKTDREFKWAQIVERASGTRGKDGKMIRKNETNVNIVLKSEAWLNGFCIGDCVHNCTGSLEGEPVWSYMQKRINPVLEDLRVPDNTIRVMCKGRTA